MRKDLTTLFTGRQSIVLPEIDSTNTYLAGILRDISLPEGTVIRAIKQNAGRGQLGTLWESEPGKNLLLSFIFYPSFIAPVDVFLLNKCFTLGVYDFVLKRLGKSTSIKWPNDIFWKNKKVGGLLIENSIIASTLSYSILGVGLNINQVQFSPELIHASSFSIIKDSVYDLDELFISLCSFIEARYLQLKRGDYKSIDEDYLSALYSLGKWRYFENMNERFRGRIRGVDKNGKLIIENKNGEMRVFDLKEIKYVERG